MHDLWGGIGSSKSLLSVCAVATLSLGLGLPASAQTASGTNSTATGSNSLASGENTTATGSDSRATELSATATGTNSQATSFFATATGEFSRATNFAATAMGRGSLASGNRSLASGADSMAREEYTTAIGQASQATAVNATSVGRGSVASAAGSVALGHNSLADEDGTVSFGRAGEERRLVNVADGQIADGSTDAVNGQQYLNGQRGIVSALGGRAFVDSSGGISGIAFDVGSDSVASAADAFDVVNVILTDLEASIASLGVQAGRVDGLALSPASAAAIVDGAGAVASGSDARATADRTTAVGSQSRATAQRTTAIGSGAQANHAGATAIGDGARTERTDQIAIGTSSNTYTLSGISSARSRQAQTGPLQIVTSDARGNLAARAPDDVFPEFGGLARKADQQDRRLDRHADGIAMALALQSAVVPSSSNGGIAIGLGNFDGATAFGFNGLFRVDDRWHVNAGVGIASNRQAVGTRIGLSFHW